MKTLDLNEGFIEVTDESLTEVAVAETGTRVYPNQSVLVAMYGGWEQIGRTAILAVPAAVNQAISVLEVGSGLEPRYLLLALQHGKWRWRRYAASTRKDPNITKSDVLEFGIPVPPLSVQRRIVDVLDSATELERGIEASIAKLSLAREGAALKVETELIGSRMGCVGDFFDVGAGITISPDRRPKRAQRTYLRVANVQRGKLDLSSLAQVEEFPGDESKYALLEGDVLLVEGHASHHEIGRCALVSSKSAGYLHQNHLFRLRSARFLPRFSEFWLNSGSVRTYWRTAAATSSGLYTISRSSVMGVPFPVVDGATQRRIIAQLDLFAELIARETEELVKVRKLKWGLVDDLLSGRVGASVLAA